MNPITRVLGVCALVVLSLSGARAAVINVEFKFTPFIGDPAKADKVQTVAGKARVFINNIFIAEQPVQKGESPVMFEAREVGPSVWLPAASLGPALRKGRNRIRIEFDPDDTKRAYRARLAWAMVNDSATEQSRNGAGTSTNQSGEGREDKTVTGPVVMEREFSADFAQEQPWHKYPPVTQINDADRAALVALVKARAEAFKPKFDGIYKILAGNPQIKVADVKRIKCLDKVYAAGLRVSPPAAAQLDVALSGASEVVLRRKGSDQLFQPNDPSIFEKLKNEEVQMCAGFAMFTAYPPRLVVVRNPQGVWEVVY